MEESDQDVARAARVVVLGSVVRNQLFGPATDPTGATVRIRNQPFRVAGVLTPKGQAAMGQDQDDAVIVPYTTVQKRLLGVTHIQNITISAEPGVPLDALSARIVETLRARHAIGAGDDDDFMVRTLEEMASVLTSTTTTMRWLLASVAAVSLLVGGIGIMNTMLVSVLPPCVRIDFSDSSLEAVAYAISLAEESDARLTHHVIRAATCPVLITRRR